MPDNSGVVVVTGANGFVGQAFCRWAASRGWHVRALVREQARIPPALSCVNALSIVRYSGPFPDESAFANANAVVHLAARVHMLGARSFYTEAYFHTNVQFSLHLARTIRRAGIPRLIAISTAKVHGDSSLEPFRETSELEPVGPYARSKAECERVLAEYCSGAGIALTVLRPPLIYGPGVKANFHRLIWAVHKGIPLPFQEVNNRRSLLFVDNFADAIVSLLHRRPPSPETYLVSDGPAVSTATLVRLIGSALGRAPKLFACPPALLLAAAHLPLVRGAVLRLTQTLEVDSSKLTRDTGWLPPIPMSHGISATCDAWRMQMSVER